ncbi:Exodeoxyribonuclease 7 large subunit [Pontiella desulfatans]|uniref:Exodeoxyribonuclease 7 large subunit n=1 Tax=Pontiella desulfatans TaxID=2750659 RepID=A0A6C2UB83_PONDE|nr:exodeoxyribonuclease VII large subunit [Pontiella desulfatans]VGO16701.1 Exodeoxyribonuclease 7 large subunit [Pontiella desulfatans]
MGAKRQLYSVSDINRKARMVLEGGIGEVWVEGELSRVTIHSSGHWYFTLKDEAAAVSCAMFSRDNAAVGFRPKDGLKVQMLARPSLYEASGRYQLIASEMEEAGKGNLQEQFEKLKAKLRDEGLFDEARKRPLPILPRKIGVVTSPTGAAIRDIINVLTRRFPNIGILLIPAKVQGAGAELGIAKAIRYLNTRNDIDVMIVGRGGGSIEDLWAFNEEVVARAIFESGIPVISAVGHEIDFTIADFVADVRAPTPSAAAELAVREKGDLEDTLSLYDRRLKQSLKTMSQDFRLRLNRAEHSYVFREPATLVKQYRQTVQAMETRMADLLKLDAQAKASRLENANVRMAHLLQSGVRQAHQRVDELGMVMQHQMERKAEHDRQKLQRLGSQLRMLNPLAVLGRGYSLTRKPDGTVVRSADGVEVGEPLVTLLADGKLVSNVTGKE